MKDASIMRLATLGLAFYAAAYGLWLLSIVFIAARAGYWQILFDLPLVIPSCAALYLACRANPAEHYPIWQNMILGVILVLGSFALITSFYDSMLVQPTGNYIRSLATNFVLRLVPGFLALSLGGTLCLTAWRART